MPRIGISPSALAWGAALIALNCVVIRGALDLPEVEANDLLQPIVLGIVPMASLLALAFTREALGRLRREPWRPARIGFLISGAASLAIYALHAYVVCGAGRHYSADYEAALDAAFRRWGMTRGSGDPGDHPLRYGIVVASLVALLGAPHVFFALLGGWLAEQVPWGRGTDEAAAPRFDAPAA